MKYHIFQLDLNKVEVTRLQSSNMHELLPVKMCFCVKMCIHKCECVHVYINVSVCSFLSHFNVCSALLTN